MKTKSQMPWAVAERNNLEEKRVVVRKVKKIARLPLV